MEELEKKDEEPAEEPEKKDEDLQKNYNHRPSCAIPTLFYSVSLITLGIPIRQHVRVSSETLSPALQCSDPVLRVGGHANQLIVVLNGSKLTLCFLFAVKLIGLRF